MGVNIRGRSFLTLLDFTPAEINYMLDLAAEFKRLKRNGVEHKYLTDKRLQTAAVTLSYGYTDSHNIAEISQQCGFREPLYFSRMFKKKYGVAPSYYLESRSPQEEPTEDSVKIILES